MIRKLWLLAFLAVIFPIQAFAQTLTSLSLINTDNQNAIKVLKSGDIIDLAILSSRNVTIKANYSGPRPGSVTFASNCGARVVDSLYPFTIAGESGTGALLPYALIPGKNSLVVTAYSLAGGTGTVTSTLQVNFHVIDDNFVGTQCAATPTPIPTTTSTPLATSTAVPTSTATSPSATATPTVTPAGSTKPPVPLLSTWEAQMIQYADVNCNRLSTYSGFDQWGSPNGLNDTYYDGEWVFYQIADYTHNSHWADCAQKAEKIYRDGYAITNNGALPGYWLFPHGLAEDFERTADPLSKSAYQQILANGAFVNSTPYNDSVQADWTYMRETAYGLLVHLQATRFGLVRNNARIAQLKTFAMGHLDQSFVSKTALFRKPFMVGLSAQALIEYYEKVNPDPAIVQMLTTAADYMWDNMWLTASQSFKYTDDTRPLTVPGDSCTMGTDPCGQGQDPAPDLNLLIAPMYAWLYKQTGDLRFLTRGDAIWAGGVNGAWLNGGKQFDQNYRLSFTFLKWRNSR